MVLTVDDLHHLMNRAVALCFPQSGDRGPFQAYLVDAMVNNRATLQHHPIDAYAFG